MATFIAIVFRIGMEDFHVKHLSDAQMWELNPIIRNAVFTVLARCVRYADRSDSARGYALYL